MTTLTTGVATTFIDFTRASNATVTDSDGKVKWAPHNLLTNSESFDAAAWVKYLATVSANTQAAPNGTTTADTVTASAGNDVHRVQRASDAAIGASANASLSIFVKAGTHNFVTIGFYSATEVFVSATFNLASGSVATETDVGTTSGTIVSTEKVDVGTGWYRLTITGNYSGSAALSFVNFAQAATGNSYTNFGQPVANLVGTETFHLWGASLYRSDLGGMQPNTSAYPLYNPTTPKNLLGYTESLTTGWTNSNTTDAIVSEVNPVGLTGAVDVAATAGNGTLLSSLSLLASPYTFSVWLKRKTGSGTVEITVDGTTYVAAAVTGTWTRFSTTLTPTAGTKTPGIRLVTSGDAVYAWGAQVSDSASLDSYVPVYGAAVTSAAYYGPRRDFDGATLACKGLLVEEQRTNLVRYSRTLETTGSYWGGLASGTANTVTIDNAPGPDGLSTSASMITYNTAVTGAGTYSAWRHTLSTTANGTYTFTIWLKAGTTSSVYLRFSDSGGNRANTLCTLTSSWQRFTVTGTTAASITTISCDVGADGNAGGQTLTAGTVYAYGAQLELGSFATSYVPNGLTVNGTTRNADVASVSTQAFPYSATEGTIVVNVDMVGTSATAANGFFNISDGTTTSYPGVSQIAAYGDTSIILSNRRANNVNATNISSSVALTLNTPFKVGLAVAVGGTDSATINGGTIASQPGVASAYTNSILRLGSFAPGYVTPTQLNGHIRQITYLPRRISNAELITRTA